MGQICDKKGIEGVGSWSCNHDKANCDVMEGSLNCLVSSGFCYCDDTAK